MTPRSAPTLVLHTSRDPIVWPALSRYLGEHIPGARTVELPGEYHCSWRLDDTEIGPGPRAAHVARPDRLARAEQVPRRTHPGSPHRGAARRVPLQLAAR